MAQVQVEETANAVRIARLPVQTTGYYYTDSGGAGAGAPLLLGLHGYAQKAADFLTVMRKIAPSHHVAAAGQGFNQLWTGTTREITFSWLTAFEKEDSIIRNNSFIGGILDRLGSDGVIDPAKVFLLGFSQGSSVAYRFAHRNPGRIAGLISVCSDLPPDVAEDLRPMLKIPILILYSLKDRFFSVAKSEEAVKRLRDGGVDVEAIAFDGGHVVPSSQAPRIRAWMRRVLGEPEPVAEVESLEGTPEANAL